MKKVITYGTFDLFHEGHYRLLKRAKALGDYLIVGVTSESYDQSRGKLNVQESLAQRIEHVRNSGFADEIIVEEYEGQKIHDIQKYKVDIFAIGSDWTGKFDYLKEYCDVVYLERTKNISSTQLRDRQFGVVRLGVAGNGRIANRFIPESKFVSGVNVEGVFGRNEAKLAAFVERHNLAFYSLDYDAFLDKVDAVYIATSHPTHYDFAKRALASGKHVLCEKPLALSAEQASELYELAGNMGCVLLEAIKTAFCPGFNRLVGVARSGRIGQIRDVEATFTKLVSGNIRELDPDEAGGSVTELASYPLLAIVKILGTKWNAVTWDAWFDPERGVDLFAKMHIAYDRAVGTAKTGLGVKSEGDLVIAGTAGYIYVPAPWWKTEYFEIRFENGNENEKHFCKFDGDGLRYELAEFVSMIRKRELRSYKLIPEESIAIAGLIGRFRSGIGVRKFG
jgi:choline-phosphate cytidylyltransferase